MTVEEAALRLHDSELSIAIYYLRIVDDVTRVRMAEGLARRWARELPGTPAGLGETGEFSSETSPGGEA